MKHLRLFLASAVSAVLLVACGGGVPGTTQPSSVENGMAWQRQASLPGRRACPKISPDAARCGVIILKTGVRPDLAGWGPSDLQAAYNLPSSSKGSGQIVAIVGAYDNPNVASDLTEYRSYFGLPPRTLQNTIKTGNKAITLRSATAVRSAGVSKSISTSRWFRPPAQTARSI
jgi:hypothetical protein